MKKALILGNTDPNLGVSKDISDLKAFLKSLIGGAWHENEIDILKDPDERCLLGKIKKYKESRYDFFLFIFGGHGEICEEETYIFPSYNHRYQLPEKAFENISEKQLSIFDCCRFPREISAKASAESLSGNITESLLPSRLAPEEVRKIYEDCLRRAVNQSLKFYACSIGEYAIDEDGGLYTQTLINSAQRIISSNKRVVSAIKIHNEIKQTIREKTDGKQRPTHKGLPRVPEELQIPFLINPRKYLE